MIRSRFPRIVVNAGLVCALVTMEVAIAESPKPAGPSVTEPSSPALQRRIRDTVGIVNRNSGPVAADAAPATLERLLVRFKPQVSAAGRADSHSRAHVLREFARCRSVPGLVVVEVDANAAADALKRYLADPAVMYAERDHPISIAEIPDDAEFERLWGMYNTGQSLSGFLCFPTSEPGADIRATEAWEIWTGDPDFRIAVLDTGVNYLHPDLAQNIWTNPGEIPGNGIDDDGNGWVDDVHGYDFYNGDPDPMDDHRHGSHVAGTIGAVGNNGIGVAGVNHHCSIVPLKIFGSSGSGSVSNAVLAMEYVIANDIKLSNNSWGCNSADGECFSQALFDVIQASQSIGHIFVAAAGNDFGNDNDQVPFFPVSYDLPNIIGVAAIDNRDGLALFSNKGPTTVDIAAPGACIYSTVLGSDYAYNDGTSMATPHVTGVVGLVMSRLPQLGWQEVKQRVLGTARPVAALHDAVLSGGVVNAAAAVWDCNGNGMPDEDDIAAGTSVDCNANTLPDECEPDCNHNEVADGCDIAAGDSDDCADNGVPDECEPDCNQNGIADSCDIRDGTSLDCGEQGNGIPDECESDCDGNGEADSCDVALGAANCNRNSLPDVCEPGGASDCNSNGIVDLCDIFVGISRDCNHTDVPDECDIAAGVSEDCTHNGQPDECEADCNENEIADSCDIVSGESTDCSGNHVPDECEPDCNGNGVADVCDIDDETSDDCNDNDIPDECEPGGTMADDCNTNGVPDLCDIYNRVARDCNSNAVLDVCDIADGFSPDSNADGVPDECEGKGFLMVPIGASGPHEIDGREITLFEGGQTVEFEIRISGWDLGFGELKRLRGYQAHIDSDGLSGGVYGDLSLSDVPCSVDEDCAGLNTECLDSGFCEPRAAVYVDTSREDYVFRDLLSVWVVQIPNVAPDFRMINALFVSADAPPDPGVEEYAGTVLLDVSDLAGGTFTVGFDEEESLFVGADLAAITIPSLTPALVTLPSDCNENGILDDQDVLSGESDDCDGNGVPDECLNIEGDCNDNLVPDACDILNGLSEDCTANGTPDECEPDCNTNLTADSCDIATGVSIDVNENGIPDECDFIERIYVDVDHCLFPGTGTEKDPYCSIQLAIDNAGDGSESLVEVVVAVGLYTGPSNTDIVAGDRPLTVRCASGSGGCIVDGEQSGPVFSFDTEALPIVLDGLTIRNGSADRGGGLFLRQSNVTVRYCRFDGNHAVRFGGAVYATGASPVFDHCTFVDNRAEFFNGGAFYGFQSSPQFYDSLFTGNRARLAGCIYVNVGAPRMQHCTMVGNVAEVAAAGLYLSGGGGTSLLENSILWGNAAPINAVQSAFLGGAARLTVRFSDVQGGQSGVQTGGGILTWENGNLDADPRFMTIESGDFHLSGISPCINAGNPEFVTGGGVDVDGEPRVMLRRTDMGIDEATSYADCNNNRTPDGWEIADGMDADCNGNSQLDSCDIGQGVSTDLLPAGGDGVPDDCQSDCNGNDVPDEIELADGSAIDCNANATLDECDIAHGQSADCQPDGVPDECELAGGLSDDFNKNGVPDECEFCESNIDCAPVDVCAFGQCDQNVCFVTNSERADIVGFSGVCGPDGRVDIFDIFAVLDALGAEFPDGCEFGNMDVAGEVDPCRRDGVINVFDILAALDGFQHVDPCCDAP